MPLTPTHFTTITEQVAEHLREQLRRGEWSGTMPGRNRLVKALGASNRTVELALGMLENEGWLVSQGPGRRRRIAKSAKTVPSSLRVAILDHEPLSDTDGYVIELQHLLLEAGHHCFFSEKCLMDLKMDPKRVERMVEKCQADAWIVCSASQEVLEWFASKGMPVFALFGRRRGLPIAGAGPDKEQAIRAVVRRLVALGHSRIVLLVLALRRLPEPGAPERAFLDELERQGIATSTYHLPDWKESAEGLQALLDSLFRFTPPTALLADEAFLFHAVKHHLAQQGLTAPGDVSLVCTDADRTFAWCRPTIAHIHWDSGPLVRRIVRWAGNVAHGRQDIRQTEFAAEFVTGGSIGPVPGR